MTYNYHFGYRGIPSRHIFQCLNHEPSLGQCPYYIRTSDCRYYRVVGIKCSEDGMERSIHFATRDNAQTSTWTHVFVDNISLIQISGTPPMLANVNVQHSKQAFVYIGAGIIKEVDVLMKNVTISQVCIFGCFITT